MIIQVSEKIVLNNSTINLSNPSYLCERDENYKRSQLV